MATVDPPISLLTLPTPREIWSAVHMDRVVAVTALVCATIVACVLVWGLVHAGDAGVIAAAVSAVLTAASLAYARIRGGRGGEPPA